MVAMIIMLLFIAVNFNFKLSTLFGELTEIKVEGNQFLHPGNLYKDPIDLLSLGLTLILGTAGLSHLLVRFFTVPTAQAARSSVVWGMYIIVTFFFVIVVIYFDSI